MKRVTSLLIVLSLSSHAQSSACGAGWCYYGPNNPPGAPQASPDHPTGPARPGLPAPPSNPNQRSQGWSSSPEAFDKIRREQNERWRKELADLPPLSRQTSFDLQKPSEQIKAIEFVNESLAKGKFWGVAKVLAGFENLDDRVRTSEVRDFLRNSPTIQAIHSKAIVNPAKLPVFNDNRLQQKMVEVRTALQIGQFSIKPPYKPGQWSELQAALYLSRAAKLAEQKNDIQRSSLLLDYARSLAGEASYVLSDGEPVVRVEGNDPTNLRVYETAPGDGLVRSNEIQQAALNELTYQLYPNQLQNLNPNKELRPLEQLKAVRSALSTGDSRDDELSDFFYKLSYATNDPDVRDAAKDIFVASIDIAVGFNIPAALMRDSYEAIIGKHWITGRELSAVERGIAVAGVGTLGIASTGLRFGKLLVKVLPESVVKPILKSYRLASGVVDIAEKAPRHAYWELRRIVGLAPTVAAQEDALLRAFRLDVTLLERGRGIYSLEELEEFTRFNKELGVKIPDPDYLAFVKDYWTAETRASFSEIVRQTRVATDNSEMAVRRAMAAGFYNWQPQFAGNIAEINMHLVGIDFRKELAVIKLNKGDVVYAWAHPQTGAKNYYSWEIDEIKKFGIGENAKLKTDKDQVHKTFQKYLVEEDTLALQSTAARPPNGDWWSIQYSKEELAKIEERYSGTPAGLKKQLTQATSGGGTQIFMDGEKLKRQMDFP